MVPPAAQEIRHQLSHHQYCRCPAGDHHHHQPRRRDLSGQPVRVRGDLEFCDEWAGWYWVLRYTKPGQREFQVPFNFYVRGVQVPVGSDSDYPSRCFSLPSPICLPSPSPRWPAAPSLSSSISCSVSRSTEHAAAERLTWRWTSSIWSWRVT